MPTNRQKLICECNKINHVCEFKKYPAWDVFNEKGKKLGIVAGYFFEDALKSAMEDMRFFDENVTVRELI